MRLPPFRFITRCENTTARQTAAHPLRGHTPLRRQHGEELEPSHRAFLRGSGSRINYSRSGPCTAAKATTQCLLIHVAFVASVNCPHVRFASESDRIAAQQRNYAQCQEQTSVAMQQLLACRPTRLARRREAEADWI